MNAAPFNKRAKRMLMNYYYSIFLRPWNMSPINPSDDVMLGLLLLLLLPVGIRLQSIKSICFHSFRHSNRPLSRVWIWATCTHTHTRAAESEGWKWHTKSRYQVSGCDKFIEYARVEWKMNGAIWFGRKWMFISETIYYSIERA